MMKHAVVVICDGLRADMVVPELTPNLCALIGQGRHFTRHRSVFPPTTRTTSASIATGCLPVRHGLEGNCVAIDEDDGLVALNAGHPDFRDRLRKATGQTLRTPTLAERLKDHGGSMVFSTSPRGLLISRTRTDMATCIIGAVPSGLGWNDCRMPMGLASAMTPTATSP